ncbi:MAG: hypothetical protein AAGC63_12025 [Propionicimonas sp.]|nr:hypothetical protein [Propionicimonas sp.]
MTTTITTAAELDALLRVVSERAEAAIVREPDGTPWFLTEDPDGYFWANTYPREDDDSLYPAIDLDLPLTVLYRPDAQPTDEETVTVQPDVETVVEALLAARSEVFAQRGVMHAPNDPADERERASAAIYARAVLDLLPGRTEAEAVIGVQRWMALDLFMALGHGTEAPPEFSDPENANRSWADWWADLLGEVRSRRTEAEVKAEAQADLLDALIDRYYAADKNHFLLPISTIDWLRARPEYKARYPRADRIEAGQ